MENLTQKLFREPLVGVFVDQPFNADFRFFTDDPGGITDLTQLSDLHEPTYDGYNTQGGNNETRVDEDGKVNVRYFEIDFDSPRTIPPVPPQVRGVMIVSRYGDDVLVGAYAFAAPLVLDTPDMDISMQWQWFPNTGLAEMLRVA